MKKKFLTITTIAVMSAMALSACSDKTTDTTISERTESVSKTETITELVPVETIEEVEAAGSSETGAESIEDRKDVIETEAVYIEDSEFASNGKLVFTNKQMGDFICNISDLTAIPVELVNGETYRVSHSQIMAMSMPGQLSQVYSIRAVDDTYHDSVATVESIEEDHVLFTELDGNQFMISPEGIHELELNVGDKCIISHTDAVTKSMPGIYIEVNRTQVIPE